MQAWPVLTVSERRILGVLVEKAKLTPDIYPLSVNAIVTGSNQKSSREPILSLADDEVEESLSQLQQKGLVTRIQGGRVERWRHNLYESWQVDKVELAILAELLLRGPQTEGELRGRASRMEPLDDLDTLRLKLKPMAERGLIGFLGEPGRRGSLISHGFLSAAERESALARTASSHVAEGAPPESHGIKIQDRVAELERELAAMKAEVAQLRDAVQRVSSAPSPIGPNGV